MNKTSYICNIFYYSMISGKFAITIHILTLLTKFPNDYLSSEFIAGSINLNPVLVRKEIANLKAHHIVESKEGKNGGTKLSKAASNITLKEVFEMTLDTINLGYAKNQPNPDCPVGKKINQNLAELYAEMNEKVSLQLSGITLEDFSNQF
ncbi:Rrf2 family transcriptional regulator [Flavobacterium sp. Fl-318]|uniref:Rrf2 family transcriptional regulator n=2 Tax=Flavobacteriaceae TaxID=49546 RepID=A0ABU4REP8_9FLAO|nr:MULTISPECIES: Rrf2 family transcriptional regulator [unclassified Flavobacterium]MDX6191087.1 Rrf2 family transcriptional regulator [Flavobacterium sp. Fl-318]UFH42592.1 Rrf2 family transcriptional regulator [Flavobacterium sp. F-323]